MPSWVAYEHLIFIAIIIIIAVLLLSLLLLLLFIMNVLTWSFYASFNWTLTFKQINQPDASISQIYCLSFKYSSTCFGHPHAHYQEL